MTDEQLKQGQDISEQLRKAKSVKEMLDDEERRIVIGIKKKGSSYYLDLNFRTNDTTCRFYTEIAIHVRMFLRYSVDKFITELEKKLEEL